MENKNGGENLQGPRPEAPRLVFTIAGKEVNIADALSSDPGRNNGLNYRAIGHAAATTQERFKPGDRDILHWLKAFQEGGVTDKVLSQTMPKFFEWAAKPEGGFDSRFLAVADQIFDRNAEEMKYGNGSFQKGGGYAHLALVPEQKRVAFYGRAYGELQGFKRYIWDDPSQTAKKQEYVDAATQHVINNYGSSTELYHIARKTAEK